MYTCPWVYLGRRHDHSCSPTPNPTVAPAPPPSARHQRAPDCVWRDATHCTCSAPPHVASRRVRGRSVGGGARRQFGAHPARSLALLGPQRGLAGPHPSPWRPIRGDHATAFAQTDPQPQPVAATPLGRPDLSHALRGASPNPLPRHPPTPLPTHPAHDAKCCNPLVAWASASTRRLLARGAKGRRGANGARVCNSLARGCGQPRVWPQGP